MVNVMKCTKCGNKITSEQNGSFAVCETCGAEYNVAASKKLGKIADNKTKKLSDLRKIQVSSMNINDISKLSSVSREILTIIEDDYISNYLLAYAESALGNGTLLAEFYELDDNNSYTPSEIQLVLEHLRFFSNLSAKEDIKRYIQGLSGVNNKDECDKYLKSVDTRLLSPKAFRNIQRDVFVCHTGADNDTALKIVESLEQEGCSCWISSRNLRPGKNANDVANTNKAIANCKIFLVISSDKAMKSEDVKAQIAIAEELNIKRVQYKIEDVAPTKIFENFFEGRSFVAGFNKSIEQGAMLCSRIHIELNSNTTIKMSNTTVSKPVVLTTIDKSAELQKKADLLKKNRLAEELRLQKIKDAEEAILLSEIAAEELRLKKIKSEKAALLKKKKKDEELRLAKIKDDEAALLSANIASEERRLERIKAESAALLAANVVAETLRLKKIKADKAALLKKKKKDEELLEELRLQHIKDSETALLNSNIAAEQLRLDKIKATKDAQLKRTQRAAEIRKEKMRVEEDAFLKKKIMEDEILAEQVAREEEIRLEKLRISEEALLKKKLIDDALLAEQQRRESEVLAIQTEQNIALTAKELKKETANGIKAYKAFMSGRYDAAEVTVIAIPEDVTIIEKETFRGCINLTRVIFNSNLTIIKERAFCNCSSLIEVIIPDSVIRIGDYAFYSCTNLSNITIGNSVRTIGESAFRECTALNYISIPNSVIHIYDLAFAGCINLTDVTFPEDSLTSIEQSLFLGCESLVDITLPASITSIGVQAFRGCTILRKINIDSNIKSIGKFAFLESGLKVKKKISILNKKINIEWITEDNKNLQKQQLAKIKSDEAAIARKDAETNARILAIENAKKEAAEKAEKAEKATNAYKNRELATISKSVDEQDIPQNDLIINNESADTEIIETVSIEEAITSKGKKVKTKKISTPKVKKAKKGTNNDDLIIDEPVEEEAVIEDNTDQMA